MIEIVPARPFHVGTVARRMRSVDRLECGIAGHTPKEALRLGLFGSTIVWTALVDGRPEAMFGAVPTSTIEGRGRPWMLMTEEATRHRKALVRLGWRYTKALHRYFDILENHVHADNALAIRWLARLGYAVGSVDVIRGHPMRPFVRVGR
jgi:hypothetical protein